MSATRARMVALQAVTRVRERGAYAHETLDAILRAENLDVRDSAFATRLAYGTIACRGTLDEAIGRFVAQPGSLEPVVGDALAVPAYELLFARTPARAAVSEGVELVRTVQPRASGLANAVLRRLAEQTDRFPWGDPAEDDEALARSVGHPLWLVRLWIAELGRDTATSMMQANNEPAPLFLAYLPFGDDLDTVVESLARDGAQPTRCPLDGCIQAGSASLAIRSDAVIRRSVVVADAGAQFAAHALRPSPGQRIVELGAGRGTKTLMAAGLAHAAKGRRAEVIAVDNHEFKLAALRNITDALGVDTVTTRCVDATAQTLTSDLGLAAADSVLVDAPCSGLGTLRRHPDRRWRARPEEIEPLAALGTRLLEAASSLVKPGGFVVYSTCTVARQENAEVVRGFLDSPAGRGYAIDALDADVPKPWRSFLGTDGFFQSLPQVGGMDGHFVARLARVSPSDNGASS